VTDPVGRVGLVFVSHSAKIAEGLVELAGQMAPNTKLVPAGGTDAGDLGTSFTKVLSGIAAADSGAGVVVLCDLGSAVLTAETALDFLDDDIRGRVRIVDAPLVEGGVAAAVTSETGGDLDAVLLAARSAARAEAVAAGAELGPPPAVLVAPAITRTVTLVNRDGLHARPAAEFVRLAGTFDAMVTVNGADAKSLLGILSLGLGLGARVEFSAWDSHAQAAVDALAELVESGFGED
jgi:PTS hybrid protein